MPPALWRPRHAERGGWGSQPRRGVGSNSFRRIWSRGARRGRRGGRWSDWPERVGSTFTFGSGFRSAGPLPAQPAGPRSPFSHLFTPQFLPLFPALPLPPGSPLRRSGTRHPSAIALLGCSHHLRRCPPLPFNVTSRLFLSRAPLQLLLHFCVSESPDSLLPLRPSAPCSSPLSRAAAAAAEAPGRSLPAPGLFGGIGVGVRPGR